jgi:flagellar assembly factor FliW
LDDREMTVHVDSPRFGPLDLAPDQLIDFPRGLIGIPGRGYALIEETPGSVFKWLHSTENPDFALPVVDPVAIFGSFTLTIEPGERELIGVDDASDVAVYVTVSAAADPADTTVNLRAPLVIMGAQGHQVLNYDPAAQLRAPLTAAPQEPAADAADV